MQSLVARRPRVGGWSGVAVTGPSPVRLTRRMPRSPHDVPVAPSVTAAKGVTPRAFCL